MERCIFCEIAAGRLPATKVYEDEFVVAFFDRAPVAEYHTLVIPKQHATDIFDVNDDNVRALASAIRTICRTYRSALGIDNLQIVCSNGADAQQDVFHLHFHIVPRTRLDGQDILWKPDHSIAERFGELLSRLEKAQETR
nr:HIT domain-containing protein [uncultured Roseibium sp.]